MTKTDPLLGGKRPPRNTFRDVPYRPPREDYESVGAWGIAVEFFRRYVMPVRWRLALYVLVATLNACSVYLMAYYSKVVVDDILMVNTEQKAVSTTRVTESLLGKVDSAAPAERRMQSQTATFDSHVGSERRTAGVASEDYHRLNPPARGPNAAGRLALLFFLYLGTVALLNRAMRLVVLMRHRIGHDMSIHLRDDVHRKIISLSSIYHKSTSPGRLMARILNDVDIIRDRLIMDTETFCSQSIMFLVGLIILLDINWICAVTVVLAMIPYSLAMRSSSVKMRTYNREIRHSNACLWGLASQKLDAMKAIFAYGMERLEALNFFRLSAVMQRDAIRQQQVGASVGRSAQLVSTLTTQGLFIYCTTQVLNGSMTLGQMIYINGAVANLFSPVVNLTNLTVSLSNMLVVMQRISHMMKNPNFIQDEPDAVPMTLPLKDGIRIDHLNFSYGKDAPEVLHDVNLKIPAGGWLCIMGPSGAGKSTLAGLLARIYEPTSGDITVDGVPLHKISIHSLRNDLAVVPQEAEIFSGTVRDNIAYGNPDATPNTIMAAAKAADCHDFVTNLPVQYETIIGEKGTTLSGGQRQRISIARALLADPKILILDDCTSALDANTERKIQDTLSRLMKDRTAVIVSQRVSMAMRCDRIVVLENGCVTEYGTHDELVANGGFYSRLYAQQTH